MLRGLRAMIPAGRVQGLVMIRLGQKIRLTRREVDRFVQITDIAPDSIRTLEDLGGYVRRCKRHYWGESNDTRFLHWLLEREYQRCVAMEKPPE